MLTGGCQIHRSYRIRNGRTTVPPSVSSTREKTSYNADFAVEYITRFHYTGIPGDRVLIVASMVPRASQMRLEAIERN